MKAQSTSLLLSAEDHIITIYLSLLSYETTGDFKLRPSSSDMKLQKSTIYVTPPL
jgi:hypothetical protein